MENLHLPKERVYVRDATITRRFIAFLTDLLFLDFFVFTVFARFVNITPSDVLKGGVVTPEIYTITIVMALIAFTYFSIFEYLFGQTPGMMLFKITAENVTLWRAFIRNAYFIPIFPFPILFVTEPLYLIMRKTRFLEVITKTRTIERIIW